MRARKEKMATKPKVVAIVGPNASGKSDLATEIARKFDGEVVSADSRQIYKGLNLSSGKVPGKWKRVGLKPAYFYQDVRHHLIDTVSPRKRYTVQKFKRRAQRAISDILAREKLPVVVGGTGFYIDSLLYDVDIPKVPPNRKLRRELDKLPTEQLVGRLRALDPQRAQTIDTHNRHRIIRAIEIVVSTGSPVKEISFMDKEASPYDFLKIGIRYEERELRRRISKRLQNRIAEGMIEEVKTVHDKQRVSWQRLEELGLEFKYIAEYLQGKMPKDEMVKTLENRIWQFAKRQLTWFKRDQSITWLSTPAKAFPIIQDFLSPADGTSSGQSET